MAPGPGGRWGDPQKHLNLQPISNKDLQQAFLNAQKLDARPIQQLKAMVNPLRINHCVLLPRSALAILLLRVDSDISRFACVDKSTPIGKS